MRCWSEESVWHSTYLHHGVTLAELVDWSEDAMMEGDFERIPQQLGYSVNVEVVALPQNCHISAVTVKGYVFVARHAVPPYPHQSQTLWKEPSRDRYPRPPCPRTSRAHPLPRNLRAGSGERHTGTN